MPNDTGPQRPTWGVDPTWAGPNMPRQATGGQAGFNYGSFNFDQAVQAALDAIKGGSARAQSTLERMYNMGLVQNGANINADWLSQIMGQLPNKPGPDAEGNPQGGMKQFWRRVQEYTNTGALPGGGGGGGPIPDNLVGAGGGGGGGGGGFQGAGQSVDRDPFGGQLGGYIQGLIEDLRGRHGLPEDVLANLYNQASTTSKNRERDRLMRRGSDFAASGMFGSGTQNRALQDIEAEESGALQSAKTDIGYANAQAAVQQINQLMSALQMATGRELGLGNLDLGYGNLGLGYDQLDLQRELGQGNLKLGQADLALQAALQEWMRNIGIFSMF